MTTEPLLAGVRVLELGALTNGAYLGMLLADLGADVIKVESPGRGDYLRDILGQIAPHRSPSHEQMNRNKRSVALDLRSPDGLADFWRLHATADVVVDGYAGDTCARLGVGWEAQRERKPSIVYCQVTGLGTTPPYGMLPTHGRMMNALAGAKPHAMGADGLVRAVPDPGPMDGTTMAGQGPFLAGHFGAQYILAALLRRDRTGRGCRIDVSGADAVVATAAQAVATELNDHLIRDRSTLPNKRDDESGSATYQYYETSDGRIVLLGALEPKFWQTFCRVAGRPDLADAVSGEADFASGRLDLRHEVQAVFHTRTLADWMALAREHLLPIVPAHRTVPEAAADPQLAARELFVRGDLGRGDGEFVYVGRPAVIDDAPFTLRRPAPALGEHTDEVLGSLVVPAGGGRGTDEERTL
ncbi:MAG: CoA transferase [Pseudonocardia sp.]|uniref:CaiB/BaiF CoA transferase family protein n=1 Tax=unclassified Pseudonocardia TaxID=2619320 RepID=UPI00086A5C61|nr:MULTISPECIES: CoA transferase [unclassified Pseudonocardia]MBN9110461.1 CoA transferase [Pseudonocardia sp.]ODU29782.1 MAG: hypothetical protein ABS80_01320 [Pseudonocardia sp. SCN 72-51]ODV03459.1 MAG: hypothetical protein ABT15_22775 [Pseudonocardia sp. SCN 73-27]